MIDESKTLGELLSDPLIGKIAPDAIRKMDLPKEEMWGKSLIQLREECFGGNLTAGFETLFRAAETGEWYYPLYTEEECAEGVVYEKIIPKVVQEEAKKVKRLAIRKIRA